MAASGPISLLGQVESHQFAQSADIQSVDRLDDLGPVFADVEHGEVSVDARDAAQPW